MFITPLETGEMTPLLRARLEPYLNRPQAPLILNIPSQEYPILRHNWRRVLPFGWRITPRRVVAFGADRLVVLTEIAGDQFSETVIPYPALLALRVTTVLLYGQLDLVWAGRDGAEHLTVEFNVAGRNLLYRGLDTVRQAAAPPVAAPDSPPAARTLADLPLKFRNYARFSLLPGEVLLGAVYQDHIRRSEGWRHPQIAPNRAVAVTDRHVLMIEDGERMRADYAMIVSYIPRQHVQPISTAPGEEGALRLTLPLSYGAASHACDLLLYEEQAHALAGLLAGVPAGVA